MKVITDSGDPSYLAMRAAELIAESRTAVRGSDVSDDCLKRAISLLALARQLEKQ